jgi:hypothetical protein
MKSLFIRARMIEDDERDLVIVDGVIADARPMPGTEPAAATSTSCAGRRTSSWTGSRPGCRPPSAMRH